jgi:hypothetical protein
MKCYQSKEHHFISKHSWENVPALSGMLVNGYSDERMLERYSYCWYRRAYEAIET